MRNREWSLVAALAVVVAFGCSGPAKKPPPPPAPPAQPVEPAAVEPAEPALPAVPSTPVAAPTGVIAVAQVADVTTAVKAIAGFADQVKPGAAAEVTVAKLVESLADDGIDLRGVDLSRPLRVVLLDPQQFEEPVVAVVGVTDLAALEATARSHGARVQAHGQVAAVGSYDALVAAGGYALTTLASSTAPAQPSVDVDVAFLMDRYGPMLDAVLQQAAQASPQTQQGTIEATMALYMSLFRQIARVQLTLEVAGDHASLMARVVPRPDTALAGFVGRQGPAQFALLARLPDAALSMGGKLDLDQVWEAMSDVVEPTLQMTYGAAAPAMMSFWKQWTQLDTGENAVVIALDPEHLWMEGLWQVAEPAKVAKMWAAYTTAIRKAKLPQLTAKSRVIRHRGVKVWLQEFKPTKQLPPDQRDLYDRMGGSLQGGVGVVGGELAFSLGHQAVSHIRGLIDRAKRPGAVATPAGRAQAIAEAKRRGESYLVTVDLAALKASFVDDDDDGDDDDDDDEEAKRAPPPPPPAGLEPLALGLGVADGAVVLRATVPAPQIAAVGDLDD